MNLSKIFLSAFLVLFLNQAWSFDFEKHLQKVTDGVYAFIGPINDRTTENLGLNNNIGFIDTAQGWVLIDAGGNNEAAAVLEKLAKGIKDQPIVAVINLGSQDHRWLGNAYFAGKGAKIYAYAGTVNTQHKMFDQLVKQITTKVKGLSPIKEKTADVVLQGEKNPLEIGGVKMELIYFGDAHFPGDTVLWLPEKQVLFTGDLVYTDRMLGVHPWSNVITWDEAYQKMHQLDAKYIVPGHGQVADWALADRDTGNYLQKLIKVLTPLAEDFAGVDEAVAQNADWPEFKHLKHYDTWHKTIISRAYLQLENGM